MKSIPLTQGQVALVDDADYEWLVAAGPWHVRRDGRVVYAAHSYRDDTGSPRSVRMHTMITGWARVDHIDHDGLNNQRENLREVTNAQNTRNARGRLGSTSAYKGVSRRTGGDTWYAQIKIDGVNRNLGYFDTELGAARAYNQAATEAWGEFAHLNPLPAE